jgi:hypothetical protein
VVRKQFASKSPPARAPTWAAHWTSSCGSPRFSAAAPHLHLGSACWRRVVVVVGVWRGGGARRVHLAGVLEQQPREQGGPLKEMPPLAPQRRPNSPCFMHLFRRVLTRSRCPQLLKANQLLAHLALLVGTEALSLPPSNCAKIAGAGAFPPPCAPPCAAARCPDWATPSLRSPQKSSAFGGR